MVRRLLQNVVFCSQDRGHRELLCFFNNAKPLSIACPLHLERSFSAVFKLLAILRAPSRNLLMPRDESLRKAVCHERLETDSSNAQKRKRERRNEPRTEDKIRCLLCFIRFTGNYCVSSPPRTFTITTPDASTIFRFRPLRFSSQLHLPPPTPSISSDIVVNILYDHKGLHFRATDVFSRVSDRRLFGGFHRKRERF